MKTLIYGSGPLGELDGTRAPRRQAIAEMFESAGSEAVVSRNINA